MNEMIERVAQAMHDDHVRALQKRHPETRAWMALWDEQRENMRESWRRTARVSIEAMREPTAEMILAGGVTWTNEPHEEPKLKWQAMIDEALR